MPGGAQCSPTGEDDINGIYNSGNTAGNAGTVLPHCRFTG